MHLSKKETVLLASELGALDAMALTHTCYNGEATALRRMSGLRIACEADLQKRASMDPVAGSHMTYSVKEIYFTLQGEGAHIPVAPPSSCAFAGCNLWSGREEHRADAVCKFCDTEFVGTDGPGGGKFETRGKTGETGRQQPGPKCRNSRVSLMSFARVESRCCNSI